MCAGVEKPSLLYGGRWVLVCPLVFKTSRWALVASWVGSIPTYSRHFYKKQLFFKGCFFVYNSRCLFIYAQYVGAEKLHYTTCGGNPAKGKKTKRYIAFFTSEAWTFHNIGSIISIVKVRQGSCLFRFVCNHI